MPRTTRSSTPGFGVITRPAWIAGIAALLVLLADRILLRRPDAAECYSRHIYGVLRVPYAAIHRVIPFSLTEAAAVLLAIALLPLLILWIVKIVRAERKGRFLLRSISVLLAVLLWGYTFYMLYHGLNFHRRSLFMNLGYPKREYTKEELYEVSAWVADELRAANEQAPRDAEGYFIPANGETKIQALKRADRSFALIAETTDLIHGCQTRSKPVFLSHSWSYTGITGMYFPLWMESNVNRDVPPDSMLFTAQHELAHTQGFAREDECNYWAYYAGTRHPDADYRYAAWLSTYIFFNNAVYRADKTVWATLYDSLPDEVKQDISRRNVYWDGSKAR